MTLARDHAEGVEVGRGRQGGDTVVASALAYVHALNTLPVKHERREPAALSA